MATTNTTTSSSPHIAIVGAGPAGLLLAYNLNRASIPFTIFESRSQTAHLSQQGGSLDLHAKTGLLALRAAGLLPTILPHARTTGNGVTLTDKNLRTWFAWPGGASKPEIDRADLIQLLISALPPHTIIWSAQLLSTSATHLYFAASDLPSAGPFTLIVGCDGAWSRVRAALSPETSLYTGVSGQTFTIPHASRTSSPLLRAVCDGGGSRFAFGNHHALIMHRLAADRASVTLFQAQAHTPEKPPAADAESDPVAIAAALRRTQYADWHPQLRAVLEAVDGDASVSTWALHALPVGFRWEHVRGATLLGDAAHVMAPFGGEGVNLALLDAWLLGKAIISSSSTPAEQGLDDAVRAFEEAMWARSARAQALSVELMACTMFDGGAPRAGVERWLMARAWYETKPGLWPVMRLLIGGCVYGFYSVVKVFR